METNLKLDGSDIVIKDISVNDNCEVQIEWEGGTKDDLLEWSLMKLIEIGVKKGIEDDIEFEEEK